MISLCPWHFKSHVPPGTVKALCPSTIKCSHLGSPCEQSSLYRISCQSQVVSEVTSLLRWPVHHRMSCFLCLLPWEVLSLSSFPWGMEWIILPTHHNVPQWYLGRVLLYCTVAGVDRACAGIAHCQMLGCQPLGKCCTFSGVIFTKEINFCMTFCVGQQMANALVDGVALLQGS